VLLEIVPGTISHLKGAAMYRCQASSVEGFIQQLAVSYVGKGYLFYVAGTIPDGKDPKTVDSKLIGKYGINVSKWTRARRKKCGLGNVHYIRFESFFVLLASHGKHSFFSDEAIIHDVRRRPISFAGYSIGYRKGRDGGWHPSVRIERNEFFFLKQRSSKLALSDSAPELLRNLCRSFAAYAPVRAQCRDLLRAINRKRRLAGLESLPHDITRWKRRVVKPFCLPD
jgi:hypothetical protein